MAENEIVWWEIQTTDLVAARGFYTGLFGWRAEPAMDGYDVLKHGDKDLGGLAQVPETGGRQTILFVHVADLEATLARAEALGGSTVTPRTSIGEHDWFAVVRDPSGHEIGLWTDQAAR